jgi:7,8-dihydroneopterin aldolase/epimerase/oxygenase
MVVIELHNVQVYAFHGIYEGERKSGGPYEVNARVVYEEGDKKFDSLEETINYEQVFRIILQHMEKPTSLLEKVALGIIYAIKEAYPYTGEINLSIYKLEAPLESFQGKIGVTICKKFK